MNESEFQNIIAQQTIKCIGAKHSLPSITWKSALLLPTRHKRNITDSKQQPETVSLKGPNEVLEGSGQLVTHPLLSLPPHTTFLLYRFPARL